MSDPTIAKIKRLSGIAGQFLYTVEVTYPGEPTERHGFMAYAPDSGPILAVSPTGIQTFVHSSVLERIGRSLNPEWVRAFYRTPDKRF